MTDLFGHTPKAPIKRNAGYGNAMFLADLAEGISDPDMRAKYQRGEYPNLHRPSLAGWRKLNGRTTT